MRILVRINLCTDGDYRLDNYFDYTGDDYNYHIEKIFDIDISNYHLELNGKVKDFLAEILCNIHCSYTHYYVIGSIFDLFNKAIEFIEQVHNQTYKPYFHNSIGGNYEGTDITIVVD